MLEESDDRDLIIVDEAALPHGIARWLPTTVVLAAVAGFMALAWYAYHAGTQSVKNEDLLVVEADKTPVKEKPADPGGMKFPDQDKTIFDTFSGKPDVPPKVERVLPAPEEPMPSQLDTAGTSTFVNPDAHKKSEEEKPAAAKSEQAKSEQVFAPVSEAKKPAPMQLAQATPAAPVVTAPAPPKSPPPDAVAQQSPAAGDQTVTYNAVRPSAPAKAEAPKPPAPKVEKPAARPAEKPAAAPAEGGGIAVQLGAYRSEGEAHAAWANMVKKNADLLSGKERLIIKADLGSRGTYYRLRVPGFSNAVQAKSFCDQLSARKQACILPAGN